MFTYAVISIINLIRIFCILARSTGEILSVSVNAPCSDGYCTFYKGTEARLEFKFKLRMIIKIKR